MRKIRYWEERRDAKRAKLLLLDGGGGGGSQPTNQTITQTNIPEYIRPQYEDLISRATALTNTTQNPYQQYTGDRVANFAPLQWQAFNQLSGFQLPQQGTDASNMAYNTAQQTQRYQNYDSSVGGNQYNAPQFQQMGLSSLGVDAPQLQNIDMDIAQNDWATNPANQLNQYQMGPAQQVGTGQFTDPGVASSYMSPYIQQALDPTLTIMQQQAARNQNTLGTQAQRAGAFGGYRQGIQGAVQGGQDLLAQGQVAGQMYNQGYQNAGQLYGADQARALQAAQGNQSANLTTGVQNLGSALQTQGLGAQTGLQAMLANQQARQQSYAANQQGALGVQQLGAGQNMQAQQMNQSGDLQAQQLGLQQNLAANNQYTTNAANLAQYGLGAQNANEASRQFGANLGLQSLNTGLQASGQLGQLGQQQYTQQMGLNQAQQLAGAQWQAQDQQRLTNQYQDFLNRQNWDYRNLGYLSDILGRPLTQQSTAQYQAAPTTTQSLGMLGLGAYGLSGMMNRAKGGVVKGFAGGGILESLSPKQLQTQAKKPGLDGLLAQDVLQKNNMIMRAAPIDPEALIPPMGVAGLPAQNMQFANGGIVGFAEGGGVEHFQEAGVVGEGSAYERFKRWFNATPMMNPRNAPSIAMPLAPSAAPTRKLISPADYGITTPDTSYTAQPAAPGEYNPATLEAGDYGINTALTDTVIPPAVVRKAAKVTAKGPAGDAAQKAEARAKFEFEQSPDLGPKLTAEGLYAERKKLEGREKEDNLLYGELGKIEARHKAAEEMTPYAGAFGGVKALLNSQNRAGGARGVMYDLGTAAAGIGEAIMGQDEKNIARAEKIFGYTASLRGQDKEGAKGIQELLTKDDKKRMEATLKMYDTRQQVAGHVYGAEQQADASIRGHEIAAAAQRDVGRMHLEGQKAVAGATSDYRTQALQFRAFDAAQKAAENHVKNAYAAQAKGMDIEAFIAQNKSAYDRDVATAIRKLLPQYMSAMSRMGITGLLAEPEDDAGLTANPLGKTRGALAVPGR